MNETAKSNTVTMPMSERTFSCWSLDHACASSTIRWIKQLVETSEKYYIGNYYLDGCFRFKGNKPDCLHCHGPTIGVQLSPLNNSIGTDKGSHRSIVAGNIIIEVNTKVNGTSRDVFKRCARGLSNSGKERRSHAKRK